MQNFELLQILLVFVSAASGCVSVSEFALLFGVPESITSSAVGLTTYAITAGIQKYNSVIKKQKKKHDEIVFLGKAKFGIIEVLISKAPIKT